MGSYEYKVVPAPVKGKKARGVHGPEGRFAHSLEDLMNQLAAEGWEYQRAETLPSEEKSGLVSSGQTVYRNVLVFRRRRSADLSDFDPRVIGEARARPLLLPPGDAGAPAEADVATDLQNTKETQGITSLLRRRAQKSRTDETDEPLQIEAEQLDDLASRFTDPAETDGPGEGAVADGDEQDAPATGKQQTAAE